MPQVSNLGMAVLTTCQVGRFSHCGTVLYRRRTLAPRHTTPTHITTRHKHTAWSNELQSIINKKQYTYHNLEASSGV